MMSMNFNDSAILNINGFDHPCFINEISRSEAKNLMQNIALSEKKKEI